MDLRRQPPRRVRDTVLGYVHLGRMLDKCRAVIADTHGEYIYPCPMDQRLLEFAGLTAEQFTDAVQGRSESEVVEWFQATSAARTPDEIEAWNHMLLTRGPDTDEKRAYFKEIRDAIDPTRTDITTWADLLDLEEGRPVPVR